MLKTSRLFTNSIYHRLIAMNALSVFFRQKIPTESDILNACLRLSMSPYINDSMEIKNQLLEMYPFVSLEALVSYEHECKSVRSHGSDLIYYTVVKMAKNYDPIRKNEFKDLRERYKKEMAKKYPWVNKSNLRTIYNSAFYGLWRDGWVGCKAE